MEAVIWVALTALLIAVPLALPRWRLQRALARPLPAGALEVLERNLPVYAQMPPELREQLQRLVRQFLHQKKFVGCAGLEVTDEMRVTIAGLACLLLLNRPSRVYPALDAILLYPSAFVVPHRAVGPGGVVTDDEWDLEGESWDDGRVLLAWDQVLRGAADWSDGQNVVLHEFAHQLDSEAGGPNGAPFLGDPERYRSWSKVLARDYAALRHQAREQRHGVLDPYGASDPAEFFAVATETFFEKPHLMAARHADLYAQLAQYYRVDPRCWLSENQA
jgi:MtfA peptidase